MDYSFYPILIVRTPTKSYSDFDPEKLQSLLYTEEFQYALSLASPGLFSTLTEQNFDWHRLSKKVQLAVYRYYNRMSFRPTPFGAFASVSLCNWSIISQPLVREDLIHLIAFPDFGTEHNQRPIEAESMVVVNPTIYRVGSKLRYVFRQKFESKMAGFRIMAIPVSKPLAALLKKVAVPEKLSDIEQFLTNKLDQENSADLLDSLLRAQVLTRQNKRRITGYFAPMTASYKASSKNKNYTLAFHQQQGSLSDRYKNDLLDALYALDKLSGVHEDNLGAFRQAFSRKFDAVEVPLLRALDPQLGIEYGSGSNRWGNGQQAYEVPAKDRAVSWNKVNALLLEKIAGRNKVSDAPIVLSEADLNALADHAGNSGTGPPSISVMFRVTAESQVFIEQAGGSSAVNIAGRFSHCPEILLHLKRISALDNFYTDNINSRAHLRDYEIPVMTESSLPTDQVIALNDLYLRVVGNRLVLRSKRLNKVIIPRLGTSFNYQLSNSPFLRFLADLQHQDLHSNLNFNPEYYLPGLNFYPRIMYKNAILSPAKWIWTREDFRDFSDSEYGKLRFREKAKAVGLSIQFALTRHDTQLVFDLTIEESISYFLRTIVGQPYIVLQEYFFPHDEGCVKNVDGKRYATQFVAFLMNQRKVYTPTSGQRSRPRSSVIFLPAQKWLYFKIYAHPTTIASLLKDSFLARLVKSRAVKQWFFVLYSDPQHHLRLRVKCPFSEGRKIYYRILRWINGYLEQGIVSDFLIGTYQPELERYGFAGIEQVELIFQKSSDVVLSIHQKIYDVDVCCYFAIASVEKILQVMIPDADKKLQFLKRTVQHMELDKNFRVELDQFYREHRVSLEAVVENAIVYYGLSTFMESFSPLLVFNNEKFADRYDTLILDLVHMHVNRLNSLLLIDLEKKVYYWLLKYNLSAYHKKISRRLPRLGL